MRSPLIAANWKMNLTAAQAAAHVEAFVKLVDLKRDVDVVICPSYLALHRVREILRTTHLQLGAQNVFWEREGAFTGQVSPLMLVDAGVSFCLVGHSETRGRFGGADMPAEFVGYFGESEATINRKMRTLLYHSINPILCVGESQYERDADRTEAVITGQLRGALEGIDPAELHFLVVAYEPVWAIGTGITCDATEANRVCGFIRQTLGEILDPDTASSVRILYGGSVKSSNSAELFGQPEIDGGLVGGASLDPNEFARIVMSA